MSQVDVLHCPSHSFLVSHLLFHAAFENETGTTLNCSTFYKKSFLRYHGKGVEATMSVFLALMDSNFFDISV